MKEKLFILISALLISGFMSSNPLYAEDKKINKKTSEKSYKLMELKNNFLKIETKKPPLVALKIESNAMSKVPATLLGAGIGLVGGAVLGGVIGTAAAKSEEDKQPAGFAGILIGGVSGLVIGGVTGYILGK